MQMAHSPWLTKRGPGVAGISAVSAVPGRSGDGGSVSVSISTSVACSATAARAVARSDSAEGVTGTLGLLRHAPVVSRAA